MTNGGMTLSSGTTLKVNNTGPALGAGNYKLIAKATNGNAGLVAGVAPVSVTLGGNSRVGNVTTTPTAQISAGELYLIVPPVAPLVGNSGPICAGNSLNLTANTVTGATNYTWSGPNGFTSTNQNPSILNATPAASGTYSCTATVNGATSAAATTTATVNALPAAALSSVTIYSPTNYVVLSFTNLTGNVPGVGVSAVDATTSGGKTLTNDFVLGTVTIPGTVTNGETFFYTVTNAATCSASAQITITVIGSGPTLTSATPNPVTGSSYLVPLTLTGSGFTGATAVLLTNLTTSTGASQTPTVNSDTSISVSFVPGVTVSSWNATVVNGSSSGQAGFTVSVPAKATLAKTGLTSVGAGKLVLSGSGGTPGYNYAVLVATNLAAPMTWTPTVTNTFDGSGNFSYTNAVSSTNKAVFFRIGQ
jgi:hypothetical protein